MRIPWQGIVVGCAVLATVACMREAPAGEGLPIPASDPMMVHGGVLKAVDDLHVETAFHSDRIDVYVYDRRGEPLLLSGVSGELRIDFQEPERPDIDATLKGIEPPAPQPADEVRSEYKGTGLVDVKTRPNHLSATLDLTKLAEGEALAKMKLTGLPGGDHELELPFRMARLVTFSCANDGVVQETPGNCETCGHPLMLVRSYYGCRKHPTVVSDREGACWKDHDEPLQLIVEPAVALPGGS